jgi:hypothetical protein
MEITLTSTTKNTANPTIGFLELCNAAANICNNSGTTAELQAIFEELIAPDCFLKVEQYQRYGMTTYSIMYAIKGSGICHYFESHERTTEGLEFAPNITETKF